MAVERDRPLQQRIHRERMRHVAGSQVADDLPNRLRFTRTVPGVRPPEITVAGELAHRDGFEHQHDRQRGGPSPDRHAIAIRQIEQLHSGQEHERNVQGQHVPRVAPVEQHPVREERQTDRREQQVRPHEIPSSEHAVNLQHGRKSKHSEPEVCHGGRDTPGMNGGAEVIRSREVDPRLIEEPWHRCEGMPIACAWAKPGLDGARAPESLNSRHDEHHTQDPRPVRQPIRELPVREQKEKNDRQQAREPQRLREVDDAGQNADDGPWNGPRGVVARHQVEGYGGDRKGGDVTAPGLHRRRRPRRHQHERQRGPEAARSSQHAGEGKIVERNPCEPDREHRDLERHDPRAEDEEAQRG